MCDTHGFGALALDEVKPGDRLVADGGFTCISDGEVLVVETDDLGLFVPCRAGRHYLDGQEDVDGRLIGFRRTA
jgi:hypothetical protein